MPETGILAIRHRRVEPIKVLAVKSNDWPRKAYEVRFPYAYQQKPRLLLLPENLLIQKK